MVLIFIAALARLIQETLLLLHHGKEPDEDVPARVSMIRHLFKPRLKDKGNNGSAS